MNEPIITGHTTLTALLGSPVAHSVSPLMHNEAFRLLGLDYAYLCFDVTPDKLKCVTDAFRVMNVRGFNLTMPDKTKMFELADEISPSAAMIGAVNTVVQENGKLYAYNTDGIGYMQAVKDAGFDIIGKHMVLLGCGASYQKAVKLADTIAKNTSCQTDTCLLEDTSALKQIIATAHILTNATSVGMAPMNSVSPLADETLLHPELIVSDIIYNPRTTLLMKQAKAIGCPTFNGLYMLLYQGAEAFRLWTGKAMPIPQIKEKYFS